MGLSEKEHKILMNLVGEFTPEAIDNLNSNIEFYFHEHLSIFVPLYNYCHYAVLPNHIHHSYSFIFCLDTEMQTNLLVEGEVIATPKTNKPYFVCFSPGIAHQEVVSDGFSNYIAVFIEKKFFEDALLDYQLMQMPVFKGDVKYTQVQFLELLNSFMLETKVQSAGSRQIIPALIIQIVHSIIRDAICVTKPEENRFSRIEISHAVSYIYQNIDKKLSVSVLAEIANLSPSHFNVVFKQLTGKSPVEYILYVRIQKAKTLLKKPGEDLTGIALACGFSSLSYFSSYFNKAEKLSPKAYRSKFGM